MKNKFLQGVTSFAVATAVCLAFGAVTASAADAETKTNTINVDKDVYVDYETQQIIVGDNVVAELTASDDPAQKPDNQLDGSDEEDDESGKKPENSSTFNDFQVYFGVTNVKNKVAKTSSWEVYDTDGTWAYIDISSLNTQKDNYVQLKGNINDDPITIKIPASTKSMKLKYDPVKEELTGVPKVDNEEIALEWRTQYSNWMPYEEGVEFEVYQQRGATLYFREAATDIVELTPSAKDKEFVNADGYELPALPGKEVKVSIAKKANGPKVTVDYVKNKVTLPANANYRINSDTELGEWAADDKGNLVKTSGKTAIEDTTVLATLLKGGSIDVKTAADKKAESKVTHVAFKAQETATKADVSVDVSDKKDKKGEIVSYTLDITNNTDSKCDVVLAKADAELNAETKATKSIAAKKSAKITVKVGDLSTKGTVYIRRSGDAKKTMWSTDFINLTTIGSGGNQGSGDDNNGDEDNADQKNLENLVKDLINENASVAYTTKGQSIDFLNSGKKVTWGAAADYTVGETAVTGVTINATKVENDDNWFEVNMDDYDAESEPTPVYGTVATKNFSECTVKVTLTFAKEGCTTIEKTITVSVTE